MIKMHKEIRLTVIKQTESDLVEAEFFDAPDSFFTSITVQDVLEMSDKLDIIDLVAAKVRKNGTLTLEGIDALDVCRRVHYGVMTLTSAANDFFTKTKNLNSVATLKDYFIKKQWKVNFASLKDGRYLLEVVRK